MHSELDWVVPLANGVGVAVLLVSAALVLAVVGIRARVVMKQRRLRTLQETWIPLFQQCREGTIAGFPVPTRRQLPIIFELWISQQHQASRPERERLNTLARTMGLDRAALAWLEGIGPRKRLLAVVSLGYLKSQIAWNPLSRLAAEEDPLQSMTAAWALVQIDPFHSVDLLVPLLEKRDDWSHVRVAGTFREAGAGFFEPRLSDAILRASPSNASRLLKILMAIHPDRTPSIVRTILKSTPHPEIAGVCLGALRHTEDSDLARSNLEHPEWHVRVQAASALGRIGSPDDVGSLVPLLTDSEWWVRYRAAQAIASLIPSDPERLRRIEETQNAPEARTILAQAIAERRAR